MNEDQDASFSAYKMKTRRSRTRQDEDACEGTYSYEATTMRTAPKGKEMQ
jgi:hypothetical protein